MWAYSIPAKILHLVQDQIFKHLATICNLSFSMGIIPTILKIAKIIPIDQKDSKLEVSNYRPMSLLSNIDNILQILYYKQLGFQKGCSTNHAILNLVAIILRVLDDGQIVCRMFIDLEKAFVTVSHDPVPI